MSKGTNRTTIRIPLDLEESVQLFISEYNANPSVQTPINKSDFILKAIAEKIAKVSRGRRKRRKVDIFPADPGSRREVVDSFTDSCWGD